MSSKIKRDGKKRAGDFKRAREKLNLSPRAFFFSAAAQANMANEKKKDAVHIDADTIQNDFGKLGLAEVLGRFEAPRYVHDHIDRTNGVVSKMPPRPAMKGRMVRQRSRSGAHTTP